VAEHLLTRLHFEKAWVRKPGANQVLLEIGRAEAHQSIRFGILERAQED
jgi:hypothetical protein